MTRPLPLLEQRVPETTLCGYCPKLCRPACPVSTVEGRETFTPWGKMRGMGELTRGSPSLPGRAALAWACTGCLHCFELCLLDNPVAETLADGRADLFARGEAPEPVAALSERWPERLEQLARWSSELPPSRGATAFLPGCTAMAFEREDVPSVARGVAALEGEASCAVLGSLCCGAPLHDAGDREGFVRHAREFASKVRGYRRIITSDAGCAWALRVLYPRFGVVTPPVLHVVEVAGERLDALHGIEVPGTVVYHDACRLGRGLGVYDPPRAVLAALSGRPPTELPNHRERTYCSGGGGLLPVSMPSTAKAIGEDLAFQVREAVQGLGEPVVVTACAASRKQLRESGLRAEDLALWIARGMGR